MYPPIFAICQKDAAVRAALGANPTRLFLFGLAPDDVADPYATWQIVPGGAPENYLGDRPDMDRFRVQIDVFGVQPAQVRAAALALRDALETHAHIVSWRGESRDPETKRYRISFDLDFWTSR